MSRTRCVAIASTLLVVASSCYVNRAIYDPYAYTALAPYTYYCPPICQDEIPTEVARPDIPQDIHPLSLAEIIDFSLKNTPETTKSWADARASAASYAQTQATAFPKIDAIGTYTRSYTSALSRNADGDPVAVSSYSTRVHPSLELSYTILDFGQRRLTSEAARYALYFSDWTHNRTIQTVVQTVTNDYYAYLYQLKLHESIEENVATAQTTLDAAEAEKKSGTKDISDVLQSKTLLLQAQMNLSAQVQRVQQAYSTLLRDMGIPADMDIKFEKLPETMSLELLLKDVDELIINALQCRPDLRAAEAEVKKRETELDLSIRKFFPVVDYRISYGRTYFKDWVSNNNDWTGVLTVTMPIFSGLSKVNAVREAKDKKLKSQAELRDKELEITEQITVAHSEVKVASNTLKVAQKFLKSSQEQYEVALKKYRAGLGSILDVVSAQDSLATARGRLAQAVQAWYSSLANLTYATGYYTFKPKVNS